MNAGSSEVFLIERYKYVLLQKGELNKSTFKIASFYQATLIICSSAQYALFKDLFKRDISGGIAQAATLSLSFFVLMAAWIAVAMLVGGLLAWNGYKLEERNTLDRAGGLSGKIGLPKIFAWYETYIIVAVIVSSFGYCAVMYRIVLPAMRELV